MEFVNKESLLLVKSFWEDINDHWVPFSKCKYYEKPPSDLEFLRDVVSQHIQCIINCLIREWPALEKWNFDYLIDKTNNQDVNVNFTQSGDADSVK